MKSATIKDRFIFSRVFMFVSVISIVFSQGACAQQGLTRITENVYSYVDIKESSPQNSFGANAGIIVGKEGIVVIDTLISSKEAKRFIKDIRAVSDKPIKYVVNTHSHLDHTFGNSEFSKLGAVVISHAACQKNMVNGSEAALQGADDYGLTVEDMEGTVISYPVLTFQDRMEIDLGDEKIELMYVGSSHTAGSITAYLPEQKVMFAGDILFTDFHPYMADGNIEGWLKVLDYMMSLDVETIIPGHGPVSGKKDIKDMKEYLVVFDKKAKELSAKSNDLEYIVSEIKKSLPARAEGDFLISANIQGKYLKK